MAVCRAETLGYQLPFSSGADPISSGDRYIAPASAPAAPFESGGLRRQLGLCGRGALVVGDMLGTGVFFTPGEVASVAESPWQVYLLWALCGAITLCGALTLAELTTLLPHARRQLPHHPRGVRTLPGFHQDLDRNVGQRSRVGGGGRHRARRVRDAAAHRAGGCIRRGLGRARPSPPFPSSTCAECAGAAGPRSS